MCSAPNHDMLLGPITRSGSTALSIEAVAAQWIAPRICATVQKNSMRRTADQVPLRLAEKKGSGMGSNKKAPHVLSVLLIFLLVTAMGVIFWTSGCTLKFQSAGGKDKAAICTIKCEPKAGFPACVARCTQDGKACDNGIRNCD